VGTANAGSKLYFFTDGVDSKNYIRGYVDSDGLMVGVPGTNIGKVKIAGSTSGQATLTVSAVAGTPTLTLPTTTGTVALTSNWTLFNGAYASGTTLTVAGVDVTGIFHKGVVLKWLSSADAFKTGIVQSSTFSTDTTITILGSTAASGDKSFYYTNDALIAEFIIPGTLAAGTDLAKTWYTPKDVYILNADAYVKTAGTTNSTVIDINDDGTTKFTTKPTITTGTTSDINNVADNPTTAVAAGSLITIDVDSVSTTPPVEAYVYLYYYPTWWVSRT
jgi:hypothetical protein